MKASAVPSAILRRLQPVELVLLLATALLGCDSPPRDSVGTKPVAPDSSPTSLTLSAEMESNASIHVQPVAARDFRNSREFPATVQANANRLAEITTLVRGRAEEVYVDLGQDVKAGAILGTLNSSELGLAQSAYLKAFAKLTVTERAFERAKVLLEEKVIGQAEYQRREGELVTARSETREAHDRLRLLGMQEEDVGRLRRDETIRSTVTIRAPFAGRILSRHLVRGEVVETTDKLMTLADLTDVWVIANVPEKDIGFVRLGLPVDIRLPAYPTQTFQGKITYVGDVLDPSTRTIRLRVVVSNPEGTLKPEMFATVRVWAQSEARVPTIPTSAIVHDQGQSVVFVKRDNQEFERRAITLGDEHDGETTVIDGLREGELLVISGAFRLKSELASRQHPVAVQ